MTDYHDKVTTHCLCCGESDDLSVHQEPYAPKGRYIAVCNNCYDGAPDGGWNVGWGGCPEDAVLSWNELNADECVVFPGLAAENLRIAREEYESHMWDIGKARAKGEDI